MILCLLKQRLNAAFDNSNWFFALGNYIFMTSTVGTIYMYLTNVCNASKLKPKYSFGKW